MQLPTLVPSHFVDVEANAYGLCPIALSEQLEAIAQPCDGILLNRETGRRIAAVLPVHVFGHPADTVQLRSVADSWELPLLKMLPKH